MANRRNGSSWSLSGTDKGYDEVVDPFKAVYGVRKKKIQGIYQTKGMACSVYVKKDDKEVAHFVTWSGLTKHWNKPAQMNRFSSEHVGKYSATVDWNSTVATFGHFSFLPASSIFRSLPPKKVFVIAFKPVQKQQLTSDFEAYCFVGPQKRKLKLEFQTDTKTHKLVTSDEDSQKLEWSSVLGAPIIVKNEKTSAHKSGARWSVVGVVGLGREGELCPHFVTKKIFEQEPSVHPSNGARIINDTPGQSVPSAPISQTPANPPDRVQPEASCADVVSAAATGSSTHTHHEQGCGISPSNQQNDQRIDSKANGHSNAKHANSMQSNSEESLLHPAAKVGDVKTIEKILPNELDIDSRNSNGVTPLMIAAAEGSLEAFSVLLERKSNPTLKDKVGLTLLHYAAEGGNHVIIEKLLSLGLDIDSRSSIGSTPLMYAAREGSLDAFSVLLERGSDPTLKDKLGLTLLHYAAEGGNHVIIEKLLSLGLDIDSRMRNGVTPLMIAANWGRLDAFSVLIERGSDPTLKTDNGETLLHYAAKAKGGNHVIIEKLLSLGLDIDSRRIDGATPLMIAAHFGRADAFSFLLERGSDPTLKDNNGEALLHYAVKGGNNDIIDKLSRELKTSTKTPQNNDIIG